MQASLTLKVISTDLVFGEGPRWRDGWLYFSDMRGGAVKRVRPDGRQEVVFAVDGRPSGLGWLPDGTMLMVSMNDHRLLRYRGGQLEEVADLSRWCTGAANDMVVDQYGHAFVGNMGFDYEKGEAMRATVLLRVDLDGQVTVAAEDLICPNGMAITADGRTLVVGQSGSRELVAFDLAADGTLSNRQVYATLPEGAVSDGIRLDARDNVWVASPMTPAFHGCRFRAGVEILQRETVTFSIHRHLMACRPRAPWIEAVGHVKSRRQRPLTGLIHQEGNILHVVILIAGHDVEIVVRQKGKTIKAACHEMRPAVLPVQPTFTDIDTAVQRHQIIRILDQPIACRIFQLLVLVAADTVEFQQPVFKSLVGLHLARAHFMGLGVPCDDRLRLRLRPRATGGGAHAQNIL